MARAIQLAKKGRYTTDPNPRVGCVLVRNGVVIAEGWHVRAGAAHAEVEALNKLADAKGATAYVSLEPCSHHGRTPPCCDALIKAGIRRVVAAMQDPNPEVAGRGLERLKAAGIEVSCGLLQEDAYALNRGFITRMTQQRPFVRSKLAMSLDGRTAMASGESKWITSSQARADVHKLRAQSSAVLTGINTVLADDPALNARIDGLASVPYRLRHFRPPWMEEVPTTAGSSRGHHPWQEHVQQPLRVVLDTQLQMPVSAQMGKLPGRSLILTGSDDEHKKNQLQQAGFEVYRLAERRGRLDLRAVMAFLAGQHVNELLVEAGSILNGALLAENLVDEWIIYMAPCILGDQGRGLFSIPGMHSMADKKTLKLADVRQIGPDLKLTYTPLQERL